MSEKTKIPIEERKARVIMKLRGYRNPKRKEYKNATGFLVKVPTGKGLMYCIPAQGAVGVAYINQLKKTLDEEKLDKGIVVTPGRYTQAARKRAREHQIELIPRIFPAFPLFDHKLVPKHEILPPEDREKLLVQYRVQPYQLPRIRTSDPAAIAIGAKEGDIVKVTRDSTTAGKYVAYRYVVQG